MCLFESLAASHGRGGTTLLQTVDQIFEGGHCSPGLLRYDQNGYNYHASHQTAYTGRQAEHVCSTKRITSSSGTN